MQRSLRTRFLLLLLPIGLPFAILAPLAHYGLIQSSASLEELSEEINTEFQTVHQTQRLLLLLESRLHMAVVYPDEGASDDTLRLIDEIDGRVAALQSVPFDDPNERGARAAATQYWADARPEVLHLARSPTPYRGDPALMQGLEQAMPHIQEAIEILGGVYTQIQEEVREESRSAKRRQERIARFIYALLLIGLMAILIGSILIGRTIFLPLGRLQRASSQIGAGNLRYRITPEPFIEFDTVREAFNGMTERLEEHQNFLHDLASRDGLTGLLHQTEFCHRLDLALRHGRRTGRTLALLMLDLDHFKQVNDRHGHQIGDQALVAAAQAIRHTLRPTDTVARYGGEEFAAILPESDPEGAEHAAKRVLEAVRGVAVETADGTPVPITVSIGIATTQGQATTGPQLIRAADHALYRAKREGRNRVRISVPGEAA